MSHLFSVPLQNHFLSLLLCSFVLISLFIHPFLCNSFSLLCVCGCRMTHFSCTHLKTIDINTSTHLLALFIYRSLHLAIYIILSTLYQHSLYSIYNNILYHSPSVEYMSVVLSLYPFLFLNIVLLFSLYLILCTVPIILFSFNILYHSLSVEYVCLSVDLYICCCFILSLYTLSCHSLYFSVLYIPFFHSLSFDYLFLFSFLFCLSVVLSFYISIYIFAHYSFILYITYCHSL